MEDWPRFHGNYYLFFGQSAAKIVAYGEWDRLVLSLIARERPSPRATLVNTTCQPGAVRVLNSGGVLLSNIYAQDTVKS